MFKLLFDMFIITNVRAQMLVGDTRDDHGCVMDGGYTWCEETQSCIRPWETQCSTLVVTEPGPVVDPGFGFPSTICADTTCPPPMPCPMPQINNNNCRLNNNVDECGCQTSCPSYDCPEVVIPKNCATWNDGCNTCQVRNGRAEICTLMYCFRQAEPYCMNYHIQKNTLNMGDICYRFCEDGSQEFINRRSDCPDGTTCKKINLLDNPIGFDSCGDNSYRCLENSSH
jgi:hypothetical protein